MKLFIAVVLCVSVAADRLENTYLPPSGARGAGVDVLNAPGGLSSRSGEYEHSRPNGGHPDATATTLRFENEHDGDGSYKFEFETENGISQKEIGEVRDFGGATVVRGSYSYMAPDGVMYNVEYIADENGFQPIGEHIPTLGAAQRSFGNNEGATQQQRHEQFVATKSGLNQFDKDLKSQGVIQNQRYPSNRDQQEQNYNGASAKKSEASFDIRAQAPTSSTNNEGYSYNQSGKSVEDQGFTHNSNLNIPKSVEDQGFARNSNLNIPLGFTQQQEQRTFKIQNERSDSPSNLSQNNAFNAHQENSNIPRGFTAQQSHQTSSVQTHQGYPVNTNPHQQDGYPLKSDSKIPHQESQSQNQGYPSYELENLRYPSDIPQGFTPQYDHVATQEIQNDNIDSSHQHDHAEDDDTVVVEVAARNFQPVQMPTGRATSGRQAFNEKTGYQY